MHRRLYSSAVEMRRLKQAKIYRRSDKGAPSSRMVRKKRLSSDAMDSEAILQKLTDSERTSGSRSVCTEEDWRLAIPTRLRLKFEPGGSWRFVSLSEQNVYCITLYFRGRKISRKVNLKYFREKIFSRIYCSRENIFPRKYLPANLSCAANYTSRPRLSGLDLLSLIP